MDIRTSIALNVFVTPIGLAQPVIYIVVFLAYMELLIHMLVRANVILDGMGRNVIRCVAIQVFKVRARVFDILIRPGKGTICMKTFVTNQSLSLLGVRITAFPPCQQTGDSRHYFRPDRVGHIWLSILLRRLLGTLAFLRPHYTTQV